MKKILIFAIPVLLLNIQFELFGQKFDPGPGKTYVLIGQTYKAEYEGYVSGVGKVPAGSSHYGELYHPTLNLGDDGNDVAYLKWVYATYPQSYAMIAISIKDNVGKGGYSGHNAVWQACRDILTGKWDTNLNSLAQGFKSFPTMKFFVRIGYEVSIPMFANQTTSSILDIFDKYNNQGINALENADQIPEFDLETYKNAFKYVIDLFDQNGVTNVAYVFHPVRGFFDAKFLYPGDDVTDWVGVSVFNGDICLPTLEANGQLLENCPSTQKVDSNLERLLDWASDTLKKPICIAESAAQQPASNSANGFKDYLDRVYYLIETYDMRCFTYINSDWVGHSWTPPWGDSRVELNAEVKNHWLNEVNKPRYIHYDQVPVSKHNVTFHPRNISIYPNPVTSSQFRVFGVSKSVKCDIYNIKGRLVMRTRGDVINISGLHSGIYLLDIGGKKRVRFVKE